MYQPIIDKELWDRANGIGRGFIPRIKDNPFILKGKIKSAISGRILTASFAKKIYPQYHAHASWRKEGDNVSISEAKIIEYFDEIVHLYVIPEKFKDTLFESLKMMYKDKLDEIRKEKQHLSAELTKTMNKMDSLIDLRVYGEITAEQFKEKQLEYTEKNAELEARITKLHLEDEGILNILNESVELLSNLVQYWKSSDNRGKLGIIDMICVELFVDDEKSLKIKENEVFEILRLVNCKKWLGY